MLKFSDIFAHMNMLDFKVQGQEKTITHLLERLCAFRRKPTIFTVDLMVTKLLHFTKLCAFMSTADGTL